MFVNSPYEVYIESYNHLLIETTEQLESITFDHQGELIELEFEKCDRGYLAKIATIEINMQKSMYVHLNTKYKQIVKIGMITTTKQFNNLFASYDQLGALYAKAGTLFRVWTPVATSVTLVIDETKHYMMKADGYHYTFYAEGDLEGSTYYYIVCVNGQYQKVIDPYALNLTLNNEAGIVIDPKQIANKWHYNQNDKDTMVIYETSVCDFTSDIASGFEYPGKYIGFNQSKQMNGVPIGIDYVRDLGITHIQLMPIYDFGSVDEQVESDSNYNWGYDPVHYNVPEGSYALIDNDETYGRIIQCQQMIKGIKDRGIGVIMDVVYNHVYDAKSFNYDQLVPNYFFRFKSNGEYSNGSFCGNEVASERTMVRRYIVDTLKTWQTIYGIDGIRIDLMGLIDIPTIEAIEFEMNKINPNFIIYGEGWNMESMLPEKNRAAQINANQMINIGHFNDDLRNFIKGDNSDYEKIGYVQGNRDDVSLELILNGHALDNSKTYINQYQLINYVSCHDDHTLYDYLKMNEDDEAKLTEQIIAAYKYVFAAKGIPFIHSGCEFKRSKDGIKNTYNKSRQLNSIKWDQVAINQQIIKEIKLLIRGKHGEHE